MAVIGSGPAGLAGAQQLTRAGHAVTVYERADRIGGLLRYGIPEFKMEKRVLERRLRQMEAEGTAFVTGAHVGAGVDPGELRAKSDAVCSWPAAPARRATCPSPGASLRGIHYAMDYLTLQNRRNEGDRVPDATFVSAAGKRVVIIGGGDTGADCLGTVHRQRARLEVHQFEILPRPPDERAASNPWPQWPNIYRVSSAHAEGGERVYAVSTKRFIGGADGRVTGLEAIEVEMSAEAGRLGFREKPGTEFILPCELVLLAMGFVGPERPGLLEHPGRARSPTAAMSGGTRTG